MGKEKLLLLDANALVHRAFHAVPATLKTKTGEPTNAVFGFANSLISAIEKIDPEFVIACFDAPGETFRHKKYLAYKAQRPKASEELYSQLKRAKELVTAFSIPVFEIPGYEADDIIGTIVNKLSKKNIEIIIATGDRDTFQLLSQSVKIWTLKRGIKEAVLYDLETLKKEKGVTPRGFLLAKSLMGDPSDNVPGVEGIGETTAFKLAKYFENPKELVESLKKLSGTELTKMNINEKIKERILSAEEQLFKSYELVKLDLNVPLKLELKEARFGNFDLQRVTSLLRELEFTSLLSKIPEKKASLFEESSQILKTSGKYKTIQSQTDFTNLLSKISKAEILALDTETDGVEALTQKLVGLSVALTEEEAYYLPFSHSRGNNLPGSLLFDFFRALKDEVILVGHNLKFDLHTFANAGIQLEKTGKGKVSFSFFKESYPKKGASLADTLIAGHLLNPSKANPALSELVFIELGIKLQSLTELIGSGKTQKPVSMVDIAKMTSYSCADADFSLRLYNLFKERLKEKGLWRLFHEVEMPLLAVLFEMERRGVLIDKEVLSTLTKTLKQSLNTLAEEIYKDAGLRFNINSPLQLSHILFEKLQISALGIRKKTHGPSTAFKELEKLQNLHPIVRKIIAYREKSKLISTYTETLPKLINPQTGRVHTTYLQAGTSTGRISSNNPNLQNIPIRTEEGKAIRKSFIAGKGKLLLSADYSQIELRVVAHLSEDPELIKAFQEGADIHNWTASQLFGILPEEVNESQRRLAKAINFSIIYGVSPFGLAETARIDRHEAQRFIERYFAVFKGVKRYMENCISKAEKLGFASTLLGLKLELPEIQSKDISLKRYAERVAINMPAQGTAAEILKLAMIEVAKIKDIELLLTVHDELVFEIKEEKLKELATKIKEIMENVIKLKVPLKVEISVGKNWGKLNEYKI